MPELVNCSNCGRVFVMTSSQTCPSCRIEVDKKFEVVYAFIRQKANRQATVLEVRDHTGVEEELILQFVKEGRLRSAEFKNLTYPCQSCGKQIRSGVICDNCQAQMRKDIESHDRQQLASEKRDAESNRYQTYHTTKKD